MIRIIDDWYVTVESNPVCYTVRFGKGIKDKKGRCNDKQFGYFATLRGAVKHIHKIMCAEALEDGFRSLPEAIHTISDIEMKLEEALKGVTV